MRLTAVLCDIDSPMNGMDWHQAVTYLLGRIEKLETDTEGSSRMSKENNAPGLTDAEAEAVYEACPSVVDGTLGWEWHVLYRTVARIANERAAKAWAEGHEAGRMGFPTRYDNPYREDS